MIQWRFEARDPALRTVTGERVEDRIRVGHRVGCALFGPYVDVPPGHCVARILLDGPAHGSGVIEFVTGNGSEIVATRQVDLSTVGTVIEISTRIAAAAEGCEVRLICADDASLTILAVEIDLVVDQSTMEVRPDRPVGHESRKTFTEKLESGFLARYLSGPAVLEVGYKGYWGGTVPIMPQAIGVDIGYPGYDGVTLPFRDGSFDAIYSSHCFEHISEYKQVLRDWYRLLRIGGYMIIVVPHQLLFEKRRDLPSPGNSDHKRYYTGESLLHEIADSLLENSYRIRHLSENDRGFNYGDPPPSASHGCYEIEVVIEKIERPNWNIDDGSVRAYSAQEFSSATQSADPWACAIDLGGEAGCRIWGPYIQLGSARYEAEFAFEPLDVGSVLPAPLTLDVARDAERIASAIVMGSEGAEALRRGRIVVPFDNPWPDRSALFEFRIFAPDTSRSGSFIFKGVHLRYA